MHADDRILNAWRPVRDGLGTDVTPDTAKLTLVHWAAWHPAPVCATVRRDLAYGTEALQTLDLFLPTLAARPRGCLVFVHGGGFVAGDKREVEPFHDHIGHWAAARGWAAATVNYRLAPAHAWPCAADDLRQALNYLRARLPGPLVVLGHSAGATHVACALVRRTDEDAPLHRAFLVSGLYDLEQAAPTPGRVACFGASVQERRMRSPVHALPACRVPLFVACSAFDPPEFQAQAALLAGRARHCCTLDEHNHFSSVLSLGACSSALEVSLAQTLADAGADARA